MGRSWAIAVGLGLAAVLACTGEGGRRRGAHAEPPPASDPAPAPSPSPSTGKPIADPAGPTNVLIVVLDDVGVEHVAAYGTAHRPPPTPTLDRLAKDGVRFDHAWSQPVCSPTRATILTGRYARRTGIGQIIDTWKDEHDLADAEVTIPEMLDRSKASWDTSAVGKWHLASRRENPALSPGRQGFDWWAGTLGNLRDQFQGGKGDGWGYFQWMKNDNGKMKEVSGYVVTDTTDDAIGRVKVMKEPWFLYVAYNAAHFPMHVPPKGLGAAPVTEASSDLDKYDAVLQALDHEVGRLLDAMSPELRARTTVMVVGDNGTPDFAVRPPLDADRAKGSVYELGVHVPLLVTGPYVGDPGSATDALVHTTDLFATVADIANVDLGSLGRPIDGVSFLPLLQEPGHASIRQTVYTEKFMPNGFGPYDRDTVAIRDARFKLVVDKKRDGTVDERLYDLSSADDERRNLLNGERVAGPAADAHARLKAELDRLQSDLQRR
ncbi:MAG: sulfatase-like hydrolase/transferase [Myxococcota bacterium]